jgi:hypothetical protein
MPSDLNRERIAIDFAASVNMTAVELREWLNSVESRRVGWKGMNGELKESVGHSSGRRIAAILQADPRDFTEDDYHHMRRTVGFIRRHLAQSPCNMVTSRWRYSLMNWGHDPLRDEERIKEP